MGNTATPTTLGETVLNARLSAGLTQEQLAVAAGITAKTVRAVETGTRNPQRRVLNGIASALGLDVSDLTHDSEAAMASTTRGKTTRDGGQTAKSSAVPAHSGG